MAGNEPSLLPVSGIPPAFTSKRTGDLSSCLSACLKGTVRGAALLSDSLVGANTTRYERNECGVGPAKRGGAPDSDTLLGLVRGPPFSVKCAFKDRNSKARQQPLKCFGLAFPCSWPCWQWLIGIEGRKTTGHRVSFNKVLPETPGASIMLIGHFGTYRMVEL